MVFGVGRVTGSPQILDDGHSSRLITLSLTDFVRGETKGSTIQCVFDLSTSRWTRAPTPQANTSIQFYGLCRDISPTGLLRIKVESLALNTSPNSAAPSSDSQSPNNAGVSLPITPSKRRKFSSPSPPSSSIAPDSSPASVPSASGSTIVTPPPRLLAEPTSPPGPMHYSQLFQQYPQYPGPSPFAPPFVPPMYSMPGYPPFPSPFPNYTSYNAKGEHLPTPLPAGDTSGTASSILPPPAASALASIPPMVGAQQTSAFDRSAADPYAYPMTQM
ncbi:hypothetical protein B0H14DRAFT_3892412 [Mycena olivaceomarginata]|nr:hypothetical protein B0H14DRAFT_3892412 [Mycena olivaceomarginata]